MQPGGMVRSGPEFSDVTTFRALLVALLLAASGSAASADGPDLSAAEAAAGAAEQHKVAGRYAAAADEMERAFRLVADAGALGQVDVPAFHLEIANLHLYAAEYAEAEPHYAKALALQEAAHGADSPELLAVLTNVAMFYLSTGAGDRAEPLYLRALKIGEVHHGAESLTVGSVCGGLGALYSYQQDYAKARTYYERSLRLLIAALGDGDPNVATARSGLAAVYGALGEHEKAEAVLRAVLEVRKKAQGAEHPQTGLAMNNLANSLYERGALAEAEPMSREALRVTIASLGDHHPQTAMLRNTLGFILAARGEVASAVDELERAAESADLLLRSARLQSTGARMQSFLQMWRWQERVAWSLAAAFDDPKAIRLAMTAALLRKGRSVDEAADLGRAVTRELDAKGQAAFERLRSKRAEIAALAQAGPQGAGLEAFRGQLAALISAAEAEEQVLARSSATLRARQVLPGPRDVVEGVTAVLGETTALIEYITYQPVSFAKGVSGAKRWGPMEYAALVMTGDGKIQRARLGTVETVDAAVTRFLAWASDGADDVGDTGPAEDLYELVLAPVRPLLGGRRALLVAPEGQLHLVPWAALHDGTAFLLDRASVTVVGSGRDLLRPRVAAAAGTVIVADPVFSSGSGWAALPGTRQEAAEIRKLRPEAKLLTGTSAGAGALLQLTAPGVLHVATHGAFREVAAGGPMLSSGLVLSGEKEASALEIAGMSLWGTQLVVLSACESARGDVKSGDGVHGLRRAFQVAGAETVVASLWRVDDAVTRDLMVRFYQVLAEGRGRAEALRVAMLKVRAKHPHPYYWAPFVVLGDGGPLRAAGE